MGKKRGDLIESICGGSGRKFNGKSCLYYDPAHANQCRLLENQRMSTFWTQCRGAYFLFYHIIQVWNKTFKRWYPDLPIDEAEDFDFEGVICRLKKQNIRAESLGAWYKYVSKTVYLEIKKKLIQRGLVPEKRNCGSCKFLSQSKPYTCIKTGEPGKKTDLPCKEYSPNIAYFRSIDEGISGKNDYPQQLPDRLLLEMMTAKQHELTTPETVIISKEENIHSKLTTIIAMLAQRPEEEKAGSKKEKRYERHYAVFSTILSLLARGFPKEDAIKHLATKFAVNEKTIRRDIAEIKEFLREKQALEWLT